MAGVLGGLGQRLGVDPVVLRIVTAVLTLFGGVGILLYAAAWLLVPADDAPGSIFEQALGRTDERESSAGPMALFLAAAMLVTFVIVVSGSWISFPLLALAVVGVLMLYRRTCDVGVNRTARADDAVDRDLPSTGPAGDAGDDDYPLSWPDEGGWPEPDWDTSGGEDPPPAPVVEQERPPKPRSPLGWVTACAALVSVGVLAIIDSTPVSLPPPIYVAVPLAIVGIGLLIGSWFGRSRALIVLGILLTIVLVPWAFVDDQWAGSEFGDINRKITRMEDLPQQPVVPADSGVPGRTSDLERPPEPIRIGAGEVVYDLSDLDMTKGDIAYLTIHQGAGDLAVYVPEDANVNVKGHLGVGDMTLLGDHVEGTNRTEFEKQRGEVGTIELDLRLDAGELTVEARP